MVNLHISIIWPNLSGDKDETPIVADEPTDQELTTSGLVAPQGIEMDVQGRIWVFVQGTGKGDVIISMLDRNCRIHPFATMLPSEVRKAQPTMHTIFYCRRNIVDNIGHRFRRKD